MDQQKIGQFIQERRKAIGLTQQELADKLGVTNKAVSKWELGRSLPDVGLFEPLCRELDINVAELLAGRRIEEEERQEVTERLLMESISTKKLVGLQAFLMFNTLIALLMIGVALFPRQLETPLRYLLGGFGVLEFILLIYFDYALPGMKTRRHSFAAHAPYTVCLFLIMAAVNWPSAMRESIPPHIAVLPFAIGCLVALALQYIVYRLRKTDDLS